ncbi:hypothetical protein SAMN02745866_01735 [Alteromonadaceae bacterium Bs31]|nr:hypothetical protein SAMN02745866_01735 [Alteromonadaceae bacterium Bs31]
MGRKVYCSLLVFLLLVTLRSEALVYEYAYYGNTLYLDEAKNLEHGWGPIPDDYFFSKSYEGYKGKMRIDERLLPGGTLLNASISFYAHAVPYGATEEWIRNGWALDSPLGILDDSSRVDGLLLFDIHPFPGNVYSRINFSTDEQRNIVSWSSEFFNASPDGGLSSNPRFGDWYYGYGGPVYFSEPGTWKAPSLVPIPNSLLLFGSAGVLGFGWRLFSKARKR